MDSIGIIGQRDLRAQLSSMIIDGQMPHCQIFIVEIINGFFQGNFF